MSLIPTPAELREIARLREGTLREHPFPVLLQALALTERTVVLEIRRRQLHKRIVVEHGVPVECTSNLVHETLGRFLVGIGRISEEQFTPAYQESIQRGVRLGEVLTEQGVLDSYELYRLLQQNLAKKLLDGFSWRDDGEFRMLFDVPEVGSPLQVKVPQLILFGITRFSQQEEADAAAGSLVGKPLVLNPDAPILLDELRLSPQQERLTASLGSGRRIDELAQASGLPYEDVTRLLYALGLLELVVPAERVKARPALAPLAPAFPAPSAAQGPTPAPPPAPAATPPPASGTYVLTPPRTFDDTRTGPVPSAIQQLREAAAAAAPPVVATAAVPPALAPAEVDKRRNELMQAYLVHRQQDAFDLLGLPEDATLPLVQQRFLQAAQRWAFWSWPPELAALAEKGQDLFLAAARAYAQLADTEQRNTLLFRRKTLREQAARRPAASMAIKTDLLDSELQFRRGRMHLEAGRHKDALQLLEFAADCDAQNGLYRAELGWCRFHVTPALARKALQDLKEAVRIDPKCGLAWYYAGEIHQHLGEMAEAEAALQRAIKLMAPDRRPIEALRALSTQKRR